MSAGNDGRRTRSGSALDRETGARGEGGDGLRAERGSAGGVVDQPRECVHHVGRVAASPHAHDN